MAAPAREAGLAVPRLIVARSPYRRVIGPLLQTIETLRRREPGRAITVLLPQLVETHWWELPLHTHRERRLRQELLRLGGPDLFVAGVPWTTSPP